VLIYISLLLLLVRQVASRLQWPRFGARRRILAGS